MSRLPFDDFNKNTEYGRRQRLRGKVILALIVLGIVLNTAILIILLNGAK